MSQARGSGVSEAREEGGHSSHRLRSERPSRLRPILGAVGLAGFHAVAAVAARDRAEPPAAAAPVVRLVAHLALARHPARLPAHPAVAAFFGRWRRRRRAARWGRPRRVQRLGRVVVVAGGVALAVGGAGADVNAERALLVVVERAVRDKGLERRGRLALRLRDALRWSQGCDGDVVDDEEVVADVDRVG